MRVRGRRRGQRLASGAGLGSLTPALPAGARAQPALLHFPASQRGRLAETRGASLPGRRTKSTSGLRQVEGGWADFRAPSPTQEKSLRHVPGRGSRRIAGLASFGASLNSPKLGSSGTRRLRVGPSICWACLGLSQKHAKFPLLFTSPYLPGLRPNLWRPGSSVTLLGVANGSFSLETKPGILIIFCNSVLFFFCHFHSALIHSFSPLRVPQAPFFQSAPLTGVMGDPQH